MSDEWYSNIMEIHELRNKLKIIDELADEILELQSPESMREVALYLKEIIRR